MGSEIVREGDYMRKREILEREKREREREGDYVVLEEEVELRERCV